MLKQFCILLCLAPIAIACGPEDELDGIIEEAEDAISGTTINGRVTAYATSNGLNTGAHQAFGPGIYRASLGQLSGVGDDATRLIELGPSMAYRVCPDEWSTWGCQAGVPNTTAGNQYASADWQHGGVSLIEVIPMAVVYEDAAFRGIWRSFGIGNYRADLDGLDGFNDRISSIAIAPGLAARVCYHEGSGDGLDCMTFRGRFSTIGRFDNQISFIEITPEVVAFTGRDFSGSSMRFGGGNFEANLGELGPFNDRFRSLLIPAGVTVIGCRYEGDGTGAGPDCLIYDSSQLALAPYLDTQISFLGVRITEIMAPANTNQGAGSPITLRGYAVDAEDGRLASSRMHWVSSRRGYLGTGETFSTTLDAVQPPCHLEFEETITLWVEDSAGNWYSASRRFAQTRIAC